MVGSWLDNLNLRQMPKFMKIQLPVRFWLTSLEIVLITGLLVMALEVLSPVLLRFSELNDQRQRLF